MQAKVLECVTRLGEDPRHPGLQTHRMQGRPGVWEARVDQGNRVTFNYESDGSITLRMNCNHDVLSRNP